jgi:hypothetical protein
MNQLRAINWEARGERLPIATDHSLFGQITSPRVHATGYNFIWNMNATAPTFLFPPLLSFSFSFNEDDRLSSRFFLFVHSLSHRSFFAPAGSLLKSTFIIRYYNDLLYRARSRILARRCQRSERLVQTVLRWKL